MRAAITGLLGVLGLGAMVSCSDPGGQVVPGAEQPVASGYNGASAVQNVQLGQQFYSTHLTGAALLQQLQAETSHHGNGGG